MFDVVAIGELLIDFTLDGKNKQGNLLFALNPGGAPANVLVMNSRLGGKTAFIGKVGQDDFGHFLKKTLEDNRIDTTGLVLTPDVNTTLAFVQLNEQGDRSFTFYRKPGADMMLEKDDLKLDIIDKTKIFHFGSLSMTDEPSRSATMAAINYAKQKHKILSYDPNWRPPLWKDNEEAKRWMSYPLDYVDIIKLSDEELEFLTGEADLMRGSGILLQRGIKIVIVTLGPKGSFLRNSVGSKHMSTYDTTVIDTTGAGDAFFGAFLSALCQNDIDTGIRTPRLARPMS